MSAKAGVINPTEWSNWFVNGLPIGAIIRPDIVDMTRLPKFDCVAECVESRRQVD